MRLVRVFRWSSEFKCIGKGMEKFNMAIQVLDKTREKSERLSILYRNY